MGRSGLYFNTIIRLSGKQVLYQCLRRLRNKGRASLGIKYKFTHYREGTPLVLHTPVPKYESCKGNEFTFLNLTGRFNGSWENKEYGPLWSFNMNYLDYLLQPSMSAKEGKKLIERFIADESANGVGMAPYCISLRLVNCIKFVSLNKGDFNEDEKKNLDRSLFSQYLILDKNLEYNLAGNHLLENIFTLLWVAYYFNDDRIYRKASKLLKRELQEQTLPDGANYEQSPMYHCIILDRLLDAVNLLQNNERFAGQDSLYGFLCSVAAKMLGWLETICYSDGSYPLFNDSASYVAPMPSELSGYARRLGLDTVMPESKESGYYMADSGSYELRMDMGGIAASYIPGHSHADTFNFELRAFGRPFIVDTGISTYNVCERRFYERSTAAHNTVTVGGRDSSRVWAAFRCAERAKILNLKQGMNSVSASHDGYKKQGLIHTRSFEWNEDSVVIKDALSKSADGKAFFHFASDVIVTANGNMLHTGCADISFVGADNIEISKGEYSVEYNSFMPCTVVAVSFKDSLSTEIRFCKSV